MSNKKGFALILCLIFIFGSLPACTPQENKKEQENPMDKEIETYLKTAKVVSKEISPEGGRTAPWKVILDDGKVRRKGHFKYIDRTRPSTLPDSYKYDIAAYELSKLLGLDIIVPVVGREIEGLKGSLQLFIEDCLTETDRKRQSFEPPDPEQHQKALEEISVFENLVSDEECFDSDDTLIELKDWKVWRVDFSMAFFPVDELLPGCKISCCSKKFYQNLQKLDHKAVKAALKPYLNKQEINGLLKRKKIILDQIKALIEEKGEESVLFS